MSEDKQSPVKQSEAGGEKPAKKEESWDEIIGGWIVIIVFVGGGWWGWSWWNSPTNENKENPSINAPKNTASKKSPIKAPKPSPVRNLNVDFFDRLVKVENRNRSKSTLVSDYYGRQARDLLSVNGRGADSELVNLRNQLAGIHEELQDGFIEIERYSSGANQFAQLLEAFESGRQGDMFGPAIRADRTKKAIVSRVEDASRKHGRLVNRLNQRARDLGILKY
jgi:hypothetical protein